MALFLTWESRMGIGLADLYPPAMIACTNVWFESFIKQSVQT